MESLFKQASVGRGRRLSAGILLLMILSGLALFGQQKALAQSFPLQIQVSVLPPYSAYLQDYPGAGQQVRVFLINTSRSTYQIRLSGQLTGDNGIEIRTSPSYRPPRPLTVPPGQTLLSRTDLEGLFDLNQIDVTGIDKNLLARGFPLPDGTYQLCIRAYNETATNTATTAFGQPLSAEFPLGCSAPIVVRAIEPPILIAPLCDAELAATTPQALVFTWTPPAGASPAQVDYTLRVVELPQVDVDPNVFIDAVALPRSGVEIQNLRTSTFLYGPTQPPLQVGKRYAWRVQAIDRSRKLNFLNDGKSPVCSFTYGTLPKELTKPGIELVQTPITVLKTDSTATTSPDGVTAVAMKINPIQSALQVACVNELVAGTGTDLLISWKPNTDFLLAMATALNAPTDSASVRAIIQTIPGARYEVRLLDQATQKVLLTTSTLKEFTKYKTDAPSFPLTFGKKYTYQVQLILPANTIAQLNLPSTDILKATTCPFTLKQASGQTDGFIVRGQVRYQFQGKPGDFPANNTPLKIVFGSKTGGSTPSTGTVKNTGTVKTATTINSAPVSAGNNSPSSTTSATDLAYYTTTDADGVYEVQIPWQDMPALLAKGVTASTVQSSVKVSVDKNGQKIDSTSTASVQLNYQLVLISNYYENTNATRQLTYLPKSTSIAVGTATVNAYGYDLKVLVSKEYNSVYASKQNKGQKIEYEKKFDIDKEISQAVAGIEMYLYRKKKPDYIPAIEGQINPKIASKATGKITGVSAPLNQETTIPGVGLQPVSKPVEPQNPGSTYILVAQGITTSETGSDGKPQASVHFERLLCQTGTDDEYYLIARPNKKLGIAPAKAVVNQWSNKETGDYTTDDPNAVFAAPEDTVFFKVPAINSPIKKAYFSHTTKYTLRSLLPPTSKLAGRLLYTWPGQTEKFVMPNMPFSVKVGYRYEGKEESFSAEKKGGKIKHTSETFSNMTYTGDDGVVRKVNTSDQDFVAGTGKTDANGYFKLDLVNLNYKGSFEVSGDINKGGGEITDPGAGGIAAYGKTPAAAIDQLIDAVSNPGDLMNKDVFSQHDIYSHQALGQYDVTNGVSDIINANAAGYQGNFQTTAGAFDPGTAFDTKQGYKTTTQQKQVNKSARGGPSPYDPPAQELYAEKLGTLTRYFYIELESPLYEEASGEVLVNAFQSKDLGEIVCPVITSIPKIVVDKPRFVNYKPSKMDGYAFDPVKGARVILFRTNALPHNPQKEGDGRTIKQPLPFATATTSMSFWGDPFPGPESTSWYAEGTTDAKGLVVFENASNLHLLAGGEYNYYVLPQENSLTYFQARVLAFTNSYPFKMGFANEDGYYYQEGKGVPPDYATRYGSQPLVIRVKDGASRLIVRLTDTTTSKGLKGIVTVEGGSKKLTYSTDANGYIEVDLSPYFPTVKKGEKEPPSQKFTVTANVYGYRPWDDKGVYVTGEIARIGSQYLISPKFKPGSLVKGRIVGPQMKSIAGKLVEQKNSSVGIPAYIRRLKDNAVFETDANGSFTIAVSSLQEQKIVIEPKDIGYQYDTLKLPIIKSELVYDKGDIRVERVKHRMQFAVTTASGPLQNARVKVNNIDTVTNQQGMAFFEFENVSVDNYVVSVAGAPGSGVIPQLFEVQNSETKAFIKYNVVLKLGATVKGNVRLDGKPIASARVYLDYQTSVSDQPAIVSASGSNTNASGETTAESSIYALTDSEGNYTLKGIPVDNATVKLRATLSQPGKTIIGDAQNVQINISQGVPVANFNLTTYNGMLVQSAFGFPLTVETLEPKPDGTAIVTGQINLKTSQTGFDWLPGGEVIRIRNVSFKPVDKPGGTGKLGTPSSNSIVLDGVATLKLRHLGKYNVSVRNAENKGLSTPKPLQLIAASDGRGQLTGRVQVVDNSFNYPSTYLSFTGEDDDNFYLATTVKEASKQKKNSGNQVNDASDYVVDNLITVLTANTSDQAFTTSVNAKPLPAQKYFLTDADGGSVTFSFINVASQAIPTGSYIDPSDRKFHLNIRMNFSIPNAQPEAFTVDIDDVVLDDQSIKPKDGTKPLELKFEDWKLQVFDWTLDPKEGGITRFDSKKQNKIVMQTGQVAIPFEEFVLRSDLFRIKKPIIKDLNIGGLATLQVTKPDDAIFTYDIGFSGEGHWKLGLFGNDQGVAGTLVLDKLKKPDDADLLVMAKAQPIAKTQINFDYIQLLSNGKNILSVSPGQEFFIRGNKLASFTPGGFISGNGFLTLAGTFAVKDAPRTPSTALTIDYTTSKSTYSPIKSGWVVEVKGHTQFTARANTNNLNITKSDIVIEGDVEEVDATPKLDARFNARAGAADGYPYWIQVLAKPGVNLTAKTSGGKGFKVDVINCRGAKANSTDWVAPLAFIGELYDNDIIKKTPAGQPAPYNLFTVYGDMHVKSISKSSIQLGDMTSNGGNLAVSDKGIRFDELKTPFGTMALSFDFTSKALRGSLDVSQNGEPLELGAFKVRGQASLLADPQGFYIIAALMAESEYIPPPIQGVSLGVAIGNRAYESDAIVVLRGSSKDPTADCKIGSNVAGVFIGGGATLFHKEIEFDIIVAEAWAMADVSLFASTKLDYKTKTWAFSAGAVASGEIGVRILCASASAGVNLWGDMSGKLKVLPVGAAFGATLASTFSAKVSACGLLDDVSITKTLALVGTVRLGSCKGDKVFDLDFVNINVDANTGCAAISKELCP